MTPETSKTAPTSPQKPTPTPANPAPSSLSSSSSRLLLFAVIAAVGCAVDLATKHWIFGKLGRPGEQDVWSLIPNFCGLEFGFQTSLNQGALFGIGQGQIPLFVTLSLVALVGIVWWVRTDATRSVYLAGTLGLIVAGILGNLWDRVGLHRMRWTRFDADVWSCSADAVGTPIYAVRDWILVRLADKTWTWPNFNIADSCLVCGAILIGLYAFFGPNPAKAAIDAATENAQNAETSDETTRK